MARQPPASRSRRPHVSHKVFGAHRYCAARRCVIPLTMKTISLKVPDDLLARLETEARARRVTKSWLIRESLDNALCNQRPGERSCYDLARDLAGTVRGLPADLAHNPEY